MYCSCFSISQRCGELCRCADCKNRVEFPELIDGAIDHLIQKARITNKPIGKLESCNCKKSNCVTGYCECFNKGQKCNSNCNCEPC